MGQNHDYAESQTVVRLSAAHNHGAYGKPNDNKQAIYRRVGSRLGAG